MLVFLNQYFFVITKLYILFLQLQIAILNMMWPKLWLQQSSGPFY